MTEQQSRELRILVTNGKVVRLTLRELQSFLRSRNMFIMFSLALLVLTAANPILFPTLPSYTSRFFYWFLSLILYVLLLPLWVRLLIRYWSTSTQRPIPLLIATAPLVIALTAMCENLPELLGPIAPARAQPGTWLSYLQNVLIVHIVEMISLLWLLPLYRGAEPAARTEAAYQGRHQQRPHKGRTQGNIPADRHLLRRSCSAGFFPYCKGRIQGNGN